MRGVYTAEAEITGVTAAVTLIYLTAPATAAVEIISASVTNSSNETNEQLECSLKRVTTAGSPAGTANTPAKHENGDQAAGSTVLTNLTTPPTTYSSSLIGHEGFSSLNGYFFTPQVEERPTVAPSGAIGLFLHDAPTSLNLVVRLTFREIG